MYPKQNRFISFFICDEADSFWVMGALPHCYEPTRRFSATISIAKHIQKPQSTPRQRPEMLKKTKKTMENFVCSVLFVMLKDSGTSVMCGEFLILQPRQPARSYLIAQFRRIQFGSSHT